MHGRRLGTQRRAGSLGIFRRVRLTVTRFVAQLHRKVVRDGDLQTSIQSAGLGALCANHVCASYSLGSVEFPPQRDAHLDADTRETVKRAFLQLLLTAPGTTRAHL
jgi:hypothetical protein